MVTYEYQCKKCGEKVEHFFDMDERKKTVKCEKCGSVANRIFSTAGGHIKRTYVGDIWDKRNIQPVSDKNPQGKKANMERLTKMRGDKQSRIEAAREKRGRKG